MKRKYSIHIICFTLVILMLTMNMQAVASTIVKVTSITLNKTQITLAPGEIDNLIATISPNDATNQNITWTSSDLSVVNVLNGTIQGVKQGVAIITAVSSYDSSIRAYCTVIVNNAGTSISLDKTSITLTLGGRDTLTATILPATSTNNNVTWTSSDSNIVKVVNGIIIGISSGSAVISATTLDGSHTASCYVEVNNPAISMILSKPVDILKVGGSDTLIAIVMPVNATNKTVYWSSSDSSIVQVHGGILIGLKEGIATITATTADGGITQTCKVTVGNPSIPTESVSLNKSSDPLVIGTTDTLTAEVLPENATDKSLNWYSSNPNVATVDKGIITAVGEGTAIITAVSSDGYSKAICSITVTSALSSNLSLDERYKATYAAAQKATTSNSQKDLTVARGLVDKLYWAVKGTKNEYLATTLSSMLDQAQQIKLIELFAAIDKADKSIKQADINSARELILAMPQQWISSLSAAIDDIQQKLIKNTVDAVTKAQASGLQTDIEAAQVLINELGTATNNIDVKNWAETTLKAELDKVVISTK